MAGCVWSAREMSVETPADPVVLTARGVALDRFAFSVTLPVSAPPPFRPVPAMTSVLVGTPPPPVAGIVVAAMTRPVASTVKTGMFVASP